MCYFYRVFQHDGSRAVFFRRQINGTLDCLRIQIVAGNNEVQMNIGEYFRIDRRALGFNFNDAIGYILTTFFQNQYHVE